MARGPGAVRVLAAFFLSMMVLSSTMDAAAIPAAAPAPAVSVPVPAPAVSVPAPAPKVLTLHEKVVAALRAAGHYGAISGLLDSLGEATIIKPGITLFAPDDSAFDGLNMNSSLLLTTTLSYHVSTTVYTYQKLSNLPLNSTIPTVAPDVEIIVTSTGNNGFRLDDVEIADQDLYSDGQVAVQGVSAVFNTAKYNPGAVPPEATTVPQVASPVAPPPGYITTPTGSDPAGNATGNSAHVAHVAISSTTVGTMILALLVMTLM